VSRIMVLGGAGFIGSHCTEELVKQGHEVVVVDNLFLGRKENLESVKDKIEFCKEDYCNKEFLEKKIREQGTEYVFHFAGFSSAPMFDGKEAEGIEKNITGFAQLSRLCADHGVKRVLYASSSSIYGDLKKQVEDAKVFPPNFYAMTKYAMEHTARLFWQEQGLESIGFRFFSVYGKNEKHKGRFANLVSQFLWALQEGNEMIIYGDGEQTRDFTYVLDIVKAMILGMKAEEEKAKANIYNVGTEKSYSLNELCNVLERETGLKGRRKYIENPLKNYVEHTKADTSKIKRELGFEAEYDLSNGVSEILSDSKKKTRRF